MKNPVSSVPFFYYHSSGLLAPNNFPSPGVPPPPLRAATTPPPLRSPRHLNLKLDQSDLSGERKIMESKKLKKNVLHTQLQFFIGIPPPALAPRLHHTTPPFTILLLTFNFEIKLNEIHP